MPAAARGRAAGKSDKIWKDAVRRAVLRREDGKQRLEKLADALVAEALSGDVMALKEIGDRLDGKAIQQTEVSGIDGGPIQVVTGVERSPAD